MKKTMKKLLCLCLVLLFALGSAALCESAIGGADGVLSRGMQWQGMSFWMTLRYGPCKQVTSSWIPTMPGKLFFMEELAGPLCADTN